MKKLIVTLALGAKALALAAAVMLYAGSHNAVDAEDCLPCMPPPCSPNCGGGES